MGRDTREQERKKEQTREAKRDGWEREQRPEYPERVRSNARELAPRWERREIGEYAAREWAAHPDGTFLERVRATAGRDLKEARSWEEPGSPTSGCRICRLNAQERAAFLPRNPCVWATSAPSTGRWMRVRTRFHRGRLVPQRLLGGAERLVKAPRRIGTCGIPFERSPRWT